jgi:LytR cell envelope-related transcriptional attenuator
VDESVAIPWRTATLLVGAVAAVELVLLIVAGVALLGNSISRHSGSAATAKRAAHATRGAPAAKAKRHKHRAKAKPLLPRAKTSVLVLNGNGLTGAAGTEAAVVRGRGYPVSGVGNAPRTDYGTSMVMYRPGFRREATRLAHDVAIKLVAPLDGLKPSALGGAKLLVLVGRS